MTAASPPRLALFDSRLEELSLPILPVAIADPIAEEEGAGDSGPGHRLNKVVVAVEKYFDLIGRVEVGELVSITGNGTNCNLVTAPDENHANSRQCRLFLSSSKYSSFLLPCPLTWRWRQVRVEGPGGSARTVFHWDEI